jgi:hypothetical protein
MPALPVVAPRVETMMLSVPVVVVDPELAPIITLLLPEVIPDPAPCPIRTE